MPPYEIMVPATVNYHWELYPFKLLYDRFWEGTPPIKLLGDVDPNIPGMHFHRARAHGGKRTQSDWMARFTDNLIDFLIHDCQSDYFILMMGDYWITKPVNTRWLQYIVDYMRARGDVIRMQISNGMAGYAPDEFVAQLDDMAIGNPREFLRGSLIPGMWSRALVLKHLKRGQTMWQMEIELSKTIERDPNLYSYMALPHAIFYEHCARTRIKATDLRILSPELQTELFPMIPAGYHVLR